MKPLAYPAAPVGDVVDLLHGVAVPDPYRWLEDPLDPRTTRWIGAQNALTRSVLDGPLRDRLAARLRTLQDHPRSAAPVKRGTRYFVLHNTGLQDQPVLYVQDGGAGPSRILLDPNELSADGTVALTAAMPDESGRRLAYAISRSGSDWQEVRVRDVQSGADLPDVLLWAKFVSIAWVADGSAFYYTRFPQPGSVPPGQEHYGCRVCFHRLGDPQAADRLLFERPDRPDTVFEVDVSTDDRWLVITARQGASDRSEVYLLDRQAQTVPQPLFTGFQSMYSFIESLGGQLLFITDEGAPRGRIVSVDVNALSDAPAEIVGETEDRITGAVVAGGTIVASYLHRASDRLRLFDRRGSALGTVALPGIGSLTGLDGRPDDREVVLGFTSFTVPPSNYRFDVGERTLTPTRAPASGGVPGWVPAASREYETMQVWYPSRDGTPISMFVVHRSGLERDGRRPVLLTGYGGFNINLTPAFDAAALVLLERGGVLAVPNLRGGGEYGESWHEAGMRERKQNVFDDFIAAAEHLIASGLTTPRRIAIEGGSNGGLLTGAVMLQRPDLFGAVVCRVPVADMLRYHLFTVGRYWVPEYGSADDAAQFQFLLRYSPYHNVRDDTAYPPVLITTADTDDRVFPGLALKFAARLQAAAANHAPVLLRVDIKAGHGAGKPVSKLIEETADIFTFMFRCLGVN
ncbi:MAG TPA: prolyl oligopeptidase family serine peptidase [Vicinamibacterales bacterium]|nr:prolyl oligopeptidase family serine peptidase [Vicinamibacterales bacterium]